MLLTHLIEARWSLLQVSWCTDIVLFFYFIYESSWSLGSLGGAFLDKGTETCYTENDKPPGVIPKIKQHSVDYFDRFSTFFRCGTKLVIFSYLRASLKVEP